MEPQSRRQVAAKRTVNKILGSLPRSGIRRLTDEVLRINQNGGQAIQLGFGQPHEPVHRAVCEAIMKAAESRKTAYTENAGSPPLRRAIVAKLKARNAIEVNLEEVLVTPGATYGVTTAVGCLINPGDDVLVPDPGYPNFAPAVRHYGGIARFYPLTEKAGYQPDLDRLVGQITPATKMIIINSPGNPTGAVIQAHLVKQLIEITAHYNLWLLSDEVYESYVYDGRHVSPLSFPESEHVVGVYSFSKTYNMTGLRVGYVVARDKDFLKAFLNAQELYISCAPSTSQAAAYCALTACDEYVEVMRRTYKQKRDLTISLLGDYVKQRPEGAFYVLVDISFTGLTSDQFADLLLQEKQVAVAPGATFGPGSDKYIRVAFTPSTDLLSIGLQRLKEFLDEWAAKPSPLSDHLALGHRGICHNESGEGEAVHEQA